MPSHEYPPYDPRRETIISYFDQTRPTFDATGTLERPELQAKMNALHDEYGVPEEAVTAVIGMHDGLFDCGLRNHDARVRQETIAYVSSIVQRLPYWIVSVQKKWRHAAFLENYFEGTAPSPAGVSRTWAGIEAKLQRQPDARANALDNMIGSMTMYYYAKIHAPDPEARIGYYDPEDLASLFRPRELEQNLNAYQISSRLMARGTRPYSTERLRRQLYAFGHMVNLADTATVIESAARVACLSPEDEQRAHDWLAAVGLAALRGDSSAIYEAPIRLEQVYAAARTYAGTPVASLMQAKTDKLQEMADRRRTLYLNILVPLGKLLPSLDAPESAPVTEPVVPEPVETPQLSDTERARLQAEARALQGDTEAFNKCWTLTGNQRRKLTVLKPLTDQLKQTGYALGGRRPIELIPRLPGHEAQAVTDIIALLGGFVVREAAGKRVAYDNTAIRDGQVIEQVLAQRRSNLQGQTAPFAPSKEIRVSTLPVPLRERISHLTEHWEGYVQLLAEKLGSLDPQRAQRHITAIQGALFPPEETTTT